MSPYQQARAVYEREPCAHSFEEDLFWHIQRGIVLSTPECFAMIRPVCSYWQEDDLKNPRLADPDGDCWMMWLAAGDISPVWELGPRKEWVAWERENVLKVWPYDRFRRLYRPMAQRLAVHA